MKIEFTKKQLIVAVITIGIIALSFTSGYFLGYDNGEESNQNSKGNGSHFYSESFDDELHSNQFFKAEKISLSLYFGL